MRALSEAFSKLASHEDTLDDSNMLKLHEERCRLAEQLRPERFRRGTWVDLRVLHIMSTGGESRFADLLSVTNPWVEGELLSRSPRVTDCACSIAGKVVLLQRLLFNKILVPAIMEGESRADMVAGVCAECTDVASSTSATAVRRSRAKLR